MNLLGIQDTLKNASDQQLAHLLQSPDSTAPSYLVLSELRRRKEMRTKQAEPPRKTVAEDLTSEESMQAPMGIRSLQTPEPGDEEYRPEDEGASIEAMREGGVIRMAAGTPDGVQGMPGSGEPSVPSEDLSWFQRNFQSSPEQQAIGRQQLERETRFDQLQESLGVGPYSSIFGGQRRNAENNRAVEFLTQNRDKFISGQYDIDQFARSPGAFIARNQTPATQPAATTPAATQPATTAPTDARPPVTQPQGRPAVQPTGGAPAAGPPAGGVRTLTPSAAPAAATSDGLSTLQQNMERNLGMFPGIPQELLDRIRASRTNEGDRRREAQNMALLEAGLRIASSNNPRLAGAIGEGAAPAVQTYNQQLRQIREDQNADLTRELSVAQADLQRRYMAGQISASEYQRQTQMLISRNEVTARLEAARIGAGSSANASERADRRLELTERNAREGRQHTARTSAIRDINKEVSDVMGDLMRRESLRSSLRQPGQPAPTDAQIMTALRRDAMNRIFPDYGLEIPATISDSARPGATVQSGVPR